MTRPRLTWSTAGLVVLAVAAVVVAWSALRHTASGPVPRPQPSALADASSTPTATPSPSVTDVRLPDTGPLLALADASTAYRGTAGSCAGGATLARSDDGGLTWQRLRAPSAAALSLAVPGPGTVVVVGADGRCRPGVWSSVDEGRSWLGPADAAEAWYRDPRQPDVVHSPAGEQPSPCAEGAPLDLVGWTATDAVALCPGGRVQRTSDAGATWQLLAEQPGAGALAWQPPGVGWLLGALSGSCPGAAVLRSVDAGTTWQPGGCVGTGPLDASTSLALAFADDQVGMALVGRSVATSDDGGYSWTPVR